MDQISKIVVVVMGMIILPLITSNLQAQIVSAPGGGIWNDSFTWIGGSIPTASDSVVINSTVYVSTGTNECNGLYISPTGIITNYTSGNNTLTVHGSITNEGVIQNNTYNFYINLYGDVYQNGIWTNYRTTFSNSVSQRIQGTQPFSGSDLFNADPANTVYVDSDFAFQGTEIDLNGGTFHIADNNTITLMGSYTNDVNFVSNGFILKGYYNSFVANTTFDNVTIEGTVHIHNNNSVTQTITVEDTLQNLTSGNYPLVTVNIVNNGTIRNNTYNFYVHISGNMTNNGTWENYNTYFNGTGLQELVFTNVFSGARFERNEMSGHLVAQSDLWFANTEIDLDNDTLDFQTGSNIYFDGGNVTNTFFTKQALPALGISGSNGFYFLNFTLDAQLSDFNDDVLFSSGNMLYGDILISGTIRNRNSGSYSVNIDGNLENNGTVTNYTYNFSLYVTGNIENHGTWDNYTIFMNGDEDQDISGTSTFKPGYFRSQKTMGNLTASSDISFQNCTIDLDGDTLLFTSGQELALDYCLLDAAHIMKNNALSNPLHINLSTDAYVRNSRFKADSMYLGGIFRVANSPVEFYGNVVVSGTLQNHTAGSYEASIFGSLINKGIINNIIYNF
ncbi:MAG: hypothetical protein KDC05_10285, partial [Bacteroidales bacterium]|nr:hypothetical protein [Bacteroidales bacterium]